MTVQGKGKSKQLDVWFSWDAGWLLHICLMMLHICPHHHWCPIEPVLLSQAGRTQCQPCSCSSLISMGIGKTCCL